MYEEWLPIDIDTGQGVSSVLDKFTEPVARSVAQQLIKEISLWYPAADRKDVAIVADKLAAEEELEWTMQVVCYGLGASFSSDYDIVRDCVRLYCNWLTCVHANDPEQRSVPGALLQHPIKYCEQMLQHLHRLFVPRVESNPGDIILRQAKECHHVLRCLQSLVNQAKPELLSELCPVLLRFILAVNNNLLTSLYQSDDMSEQLSSRVLGVLVEVWVASCAAGQFPSPSYWKTLYQCCLQWRHRLALIDQWIRLIACLSHHFLGHCIRPDYSRVKLSRAEQALRAESLPKDVLLECWFRFMHIIDNPADIATPHFMDQLLSRVESTMVAPELTYQTCISQVPFLFFRAMHGVMMFVNIFLGEHCDLSAALKLPYLNATDGGISTHRTSVQSPISPATPSTNVTSKPTSGGGPLHLVLQPPSFSRGREGSVGEKSPATPAKSPGANQRLASAISTILSEMGPKIVTGRQFNASRPNVELLLQLFGSWLFSGARSLDRIPDDTHSQHSTKSYDTESKASIDVQDDALGDTVGVQAGRALSLAALCRIYCSKRVNEPLKEELLCKFYALLYTAFKEADGLIVSTILIYGQDLFRKDLPAVQMLLPAALSAVQQVLKLPLARLHPGLSRNESRRSCLLFLASMVGIPFHYARHRVKGFSEDEESLIECRRGLGNTLFVSLTEETDTVNLQICLYIMTQFMVYCCFYEHQQDPTDTNTFSRGILHTFLQHIVMEMSSSWLQNHAVCMAAVDCICTLRNLPTACIDTAVATSVMCGLSRLIEQELSRPHPAHSREMHSLVVAAYNALSNWITVMPLSSSQETRKGLDAVTRVIQLGVTGAVSDELTENTKPASQRVKDAGEQLLSSLTGTAAMDSSVLECSSWLGKTALAPRHYLARNTVLISIVQDQPDSAVVVFRHCVGSGAWRFRLKYSNPDDKNLIPNGDVHHDQETNQRVTKTDRENNESKNHNVIPRFFPPGVERIPQVKADHAVPPLKLTDTADKVLTIMQEHSKLEKWRSAKNEDKFEPVISPRNHASNETSSCKVPVILLKSLIIPSQFYIPERNDVVMLQSKDPMDLTTDIALLDSMSGRLSVHAHCFYVPSGQTSALQILEAKPQSRYFRLMRALGKVVAVRSLKDFPQMAPAAGAASQQQTNELEKNSDGVLSLDGRKHVLHFSDGCCDMYFVQPSTRSSARGAALVHMNGTGPVPHQQSAQHTLQADSNVSPRDTFDMKPFGSLISLLNVDSLAAGTGSNSSLASVSINYPIMAHARSARGYSVSEGIDHLNLSVEKKHSTSSVRFASPPTSPELPPRRKHSRLLGLFSTGGSKHAPQSTPGAYYRLSPSESMPLDALSASSVTGPFGGGTSMATGTSAGQQGLSVDANNLAPPVRPPRSKSINTDAGDLPLTASSTGKTKRERANSQLYQAYRILMVWVENQEDIAKFPKDELLPYCMPADLVPTENCSVLFVHPIGVDGLCLVRLECACTKLGDAGPLVDGSVVSESMLPLLLRQTIVNLARRWRLELEGIVLPHVRRRMKLQDLCAKYKQQVTPSEFLITLINS